MAGGIKVRHPNHCATSKGNNTICNDNDDDHHRHHHSPHRNIIFIIRVSPKMLMSLPSLLAILPLAALLLLSPLLLRLPSRSLTTGDTSNDHRSKEVRAKGSNLATIIVADIHTHTHTLTSSTPLAAITMATVSAACKVLKERMTLS